jgi:hypothetical protein
MNTTRNILLSASFIAALALNGTPSQAAAASSTLTMKPLHGISFDVGSERAVSYFLSEAGQCKLVVTLAQAPDADAPAAFTATRFEAAIHAGKATRYTEAGGKTVEFECAADAAAMAVTPIDQVADTADR